MLSRYKRLIWTTGIVVLIILGFLLYQMLQFRITGTTPDHRNYPNSLGTLEVYFSKQLDKPSLESRIASDLSSLVSVNFESGVQATVDDKKLTITFSQTPADGEYEVKLSAILSAGGDSLSATLPLIVKDIPFNELSEEEKKMYNALSSDVVDTHIDDYPLLDKLPHQTDRYHIGYEYDHSDPSPLLTISMKFFEPGSNAKPATAEDKQVYLNDLRKYRNEALDWLRAQDPKFLEKYSIRYSELDLQSEFPRGRGRYFEGVDDSHEHAE